MIFNTIVMKSNIRILVILSILSFTCLPSQAQGPGEHQGRMEKYRSMRIAYFTEKLQFTPEEAEKFWPLYNAFEQKKNEVRKQRRKQSMEFHKNFEQLSDEDAVKLIDEHIRLKQDETKLDTEFHEELKKVLPAKKIMKFYITEIQFREYMLHKLREERRQGPRGREKR